MAIEQLRSLTYEHLEALAIGAGILGTGGGGSPYMNKIYVAEILRNGGEVPIVPVAELPDDAVVTPCGGVGAPTVSIERLKEGQEFLRALRALEQYTGRNATHMISGEIGGGNSISPIIVALQAGLPVVDGDGMGRAFPELQMDTFSIYGVKPTPNAISDVRGHVVVYDHIDDAHDLERYIRTVTVQMGGGTGMTGPMISGDEVRRTAVRGTLSFAVRLGEAVLAARAVHHNPVEAAAEMSGGHLLLTGKITDVDRRFVAGFARGRLELEGMGDFTGHRYSIDFQNENLIVTDEAGEVLCSVPDLICIVDAETAEPISTETLRYGLRVAVLGIPAPHLIATPEALDVVGPAAFGYPDVTYHPLEGVYGGKLANLVSPS
ncbi:MAG TPA: DUF917 domain-containing protein [Thermomicrobiales bacterium]|nr:DUF917 domain-containing protein [Thermomicrobiales bacterium]